MAGDEREKDLLTGWLSFLWMLYSLRACLRGGGGGGGVTWKRCSSKVHMLMCGMVVYGKCICVDVCDGVHMCVDV